MRTLLLFDDDPQSIATLRELVETSMPADVPFSIQEASDLTTLKYLLATGTQPDILLTDIVMPKGQPSGIDIVRALFPPESGTQIIYVSGYLEMAPEVYTTPHLYFLLKPVDPEKLAEALERACASLARRKPKTLRIRAGYKERLINVSTITYLESIAHKVIVHCRSTSYETYSKLSDILASLPQSFCRCHRSYAVNLAYVSSLDEDEVTLHDGTRIPVSRRRAHQTQRDLLTYLSTRTQG
jgi:DNA-binding LytR/AlgR family response regulator